ncbi:hypothetical protein D4R52_02975, partial [bacterium]
MFFQRFFKMGPGLKDFWSRAGSWLQTYKSSRTADYRPQINDEGLISQNIESVKVSADKSQHAGQVVVKAVQPIDRPESIEKLQVGFDKLIDKLQGINEHLNHQITQHEELINRLDSLPRILESFPAVVENQNRLTEQLFEQLKATATKSQQFIDILEEIPAETAKQTNTLEDIDHQLAAAAAADVQAAESFNKFHETLAKLNERTTEQTDGILQMNRTFAASDRYLKYLISQQ